MDSVTTPFLSPSGVAIGIVVVLLSIYVAYTWYNGRPTVPAPTYITGFTNASNVKDAKDSSGNGGVYKDALYADEWFGNPPGKPADTAPPVNPLPALLNTMGSQAKEGFFGGVAVGSGTPDCLRSSSEGAALVALFSNRQPSSDDSEANLRELTQIVSKLSCFKKDLVSPSYIVEATRYQQFVTMHDIEPIAETTGRCFAKTISPRDLELAFDKWTSRGEILVRRLCSEYQLSAKEVDSAQELFRALIRDVKDVARSMCLQGEPTIAGKPGPRDPHPFEAPEYVELGTYTGYY
jgi:hypothetical protein